MNSLYPIAFTVFIGQRLLEMLWSKRNEKILIQQGQRIFFSNELLWLKIFHGAWFGAQIFEHFFAAQEVPPGLAYSALGMCLLGQLLRLFSQMALGKNWTIAIIGHPSKERLAKGIYRWFRHPNYFGVALELIGLPILGGAYITALAFGLANSAILIRRINQEEALFRGDLYA